MCSSAGRHSSTSQRATTCCFPASRETRWGNTGRPQRSLGKSIWWQTRGRTGFPHPTRVLVLVRPACDACATGASWGPCCCWPPCTTCRTWLRLSRSCSGPTTTCRHRSGRRCDRGPARPAFCRPCMHRRRHGRGAAVVLPAGYGWGPRDARWPQLSSGAHNGRYFVRPVFRNGM